MNNNFNYTIKKKKKRSVNNLLMKSFFGQSLDKICDWYPIMITKNDVFDYLVQLREYDVIAMIGAYNNNADENDVDCLVGFQTYCGILQELSRRVCYSMCESIDNSLEENERDYLGNLTRNKSSITDYKINQYKEFIDGDEAGKRFITKIEFEEFLKEPAELRTSNLNNYDYSIESLFLMLYQHKKEYHLTDEKIITSIIPRGNHSWSHEGIANEYLKYNNFLSCEYNDKSLSFDNSMIMDHFFDPISIVG